MAVGCVAGLGVEGFVEAAASFSDVAVVAAGAGVAVG